MSRPPSGRPSGQTESHGAGSTGPGGAGGSGSNAGAPAQAAPAAEALTQEEFVALQAELAQILRGRIHGFCFSPYLEGQAPGSLVSEAQIRARLELIRPYTRWIRTFSCTDGHEETPRIAHEMGLKTLVGAWLGTDPKINEREIEGAIAVARAGHADLLAVGNEVLYREEMTEEELIECLERVKAARPNCPVGYVDAYYFFEKHPHVAAACEVLFANCYPFWEGCPRERSLAYMQSMYQRTLAAAQGKRVVISETGWPQTGTPLHGAVPSVAGAIRYFIDTCRWAAREDIEFFYFAAFDEAWKVGVEGDVGAHWGLWDRHGAPKYF